mgnify:FL=1
MTLNPLSFLSPPQLLSPQELSLPLPPYLCFLCTNHNLHCSAGFPISSSAPDTLSKDQNKPLQCSTNYGWMPSSRKYSLLQTPLSPPTTINIPTKCCCNFLDWRLSSCSCMVAIGVFVTQNAQNHRNAIICCPHSLALTRIVQWLQVYDSSTQWMLSTSTQDIIDG